MQVVHRPHLPRPTLKAQSPTITPWGLLNHLRPDHLDRLARQDQTKTPQQIDRLCQVLEAYRLVYLPDYLARRSTPASSPTWAQLQQMVDILNQQEGLAEMPWTIAEVGWQLRSMVHLLQVRR